MEQRQLSSKKSISAEDWRKTPLNDERLLELIGKKNHLIQYLDSTSIGIALYNSKGQIFYINDKGLSLLGIEHSSSLSLAELTKAFRAYRKNTQELYPYEALPSTKALAGETALADDLEIHRQDRIIPLTVLAAPIFDREGQINSVIATFQDISPRRCSAQKHQVPQIPTDLVLRSLPDTTIVFANEAVCSFLGKTPENIIERQWSYLILPEELDELHQKIAALSTENPTFESINRIYCDNRQISWIQWTQQGIFDLQGKLVEIQSVGRDVTALQRQIQRERILNRVFQAIRNSLDLETIFATATAETARLLDVSSCCVVRYLTEKGIWQHIAEFRQNSDIPSAMRLKIPDKDNPIAAKLKQLQKVIVNTTEELKDEVNKKIAQTHSGAWLIIPLTVEGKLWGGFSLSTTRHPYIWQDDQVKLAQAVANQLEVAIQQANLYRQAQLELAERQRVEAALKQSESRYASLAAAAPVGIFRATATGTCTYVNERCCQITGLTRETSLEEGWRKGLHPDDRALVTTEWENSVRENRPFKLEYRFLHPDGTVRWVYSQSVAERDGKGRIIGYVGTLVDISDRKQAEHQLIASENKFRSIFDNAPIGIVYGSIETSPPRLLACNHRFCQMLGYTADELLRLTAADITHPDDRKPFDRPELVSGEIPCFILEKRYLRKDGTIMWAKTTVSLLKDEAGKPLNTVVIVEDISERQAALRERKEAEAALRDSEVRYRLVTENMKDLVCLHDLDGKYLYVSPSCQTLLGYSQEEMLGQDPYTFFHPSDRERNYREHIAAIDANLEPIAYRMRSKSGEYIWFETLTKPIVDSMGRVVQLQTTSRNVTEKIKIQERLRHDAFHDILTGLPNRALLMQRLELAIERINSLENYCFAVLFLDLDRFKVINDSLGHQAGDRLLIHVAQKLQSILRSTDLAVRLGGDEFVVLLEDIKGLSEVIQIPKRIFAELQTPLLIEGCEVYTTSSIGIVMGDRNYTEASQLLRDADLAMYRAKTNGTQYEIFGKEMHVRALNRLHLENDLRKALKQQEFLLYYQPIFALDTKAIVGFEALIRWQHPTQGLKTPNEFIQIAEETGTISLIDSWTFRTACKQLTAWQRAFADFSTLKISINLSAPDLRRPNLIDEIDRVLGQTGLAGCCLTLEITENIAIEDIEFTIVLLDRLKERGLQISIDDFGTGYSSLSYLHRLPVDSLKIDRTFVSQMEESKRNYRIIETIATLSNQLELVTIAEGIETQQQLELLQKLGCKFGQGFWFSPALNCEAATALLARNSSQHGDR